MKWGVFLMLFPSILYSATTPDGSVNETVTDEVSGGLTTSMPAHKLSKEYSPNMRNVFIDDNSIEQVNGFIQIGSTNTLGRADQIYPYNLEDGTALFLVSDSSVVLETADFRNFVFISSGHNTGVLMRCKQVENKMWCSNGVDSVFTWDHSIKKILNGLNTPTGVSTPNVPKGKYIEYYQDRVWVFNVPFDASVAYFSDVRSTNGVIIAPDNFLAWPADNFRFIGRGDGQLGTAIYQDNGRLKFGKERSIYTLYGEDETNFKPILSNPTAGIASHDSIVMLDGQSHFLGNDGIYRNEDRKSDLIDDVSDTINKASVRTLSNLWESQMDFSRGQFFNTTATPAGLVTYLEGIDKYVALSDFSDPPSSVFNLTSVSTFIPNTVFTTTVTLESGSRFIIPFSGEVFRFLGKTTGGCSLVALAEVNIFNSRTQGFASYVFSGLDQTNYTGVGASAANGLTGLGMSITGEDISSGKISTMVRFLNASSATCGIDIANIPTANTWQFKLQRDTAGMFMSEVSTITSVTAWGNFESLFNTAGGNISFYFRSSTALVTLTTQTWATISPGSIISVPVAQRFVQWSSTLSGGTILNSPSIDNVEIVHIEGAGALNRAFGAKWKNRYWLSVSTSLDSVSSYILVKSKLTNKNQDAWMPISGINIRSMVNANDQTFYAGSSTAGVFFRLDFGNNFNGNFIDSLYETPDVWFDSLYKEKILTEYSVTAQRNGGSFNLGLSIDGDDFQVSTITATGTGLLNRGIFNVSGKGKFFRWRFQHKNFDEPFQFHNFSVRYKPTEIRKGTND